MITELAPRPERTRPVNLDEALLAKLTEAVYSVALRRRFEGPFLDIELELWNALRGVLRDAA